MDKLAVEYEWHEERNPTTERHAQLIKDGWHFDRVIDVVRWLYYRPKRKQEQPGPKEFK